MNLKSVNHFREPRLSCLFLQAAAVTDSTLDTCSQVKLHAVKFTQQQRPDPHFRRPQTFNLGKCKLGTKDGKLSLIRFKDRVNVVRPAAACYTDCIIGARTAWRFCYRIPRMQSEIAISSVIQKKSAWNIRHGKARGARPLLIYCHFMAGRVEFLSTFATV